MFDNGQNFELNTRNVPDDELGVFALYAHCILDEKDYEEKFKMLMDFQIEIYTLQRNFKIPILHFMKDHRMLIENKLSQAHYTKTADYRAQPDKSVKDLLNFVYCLLGYGAFYQCPTECTRDNQDH